MFKSFGGYLLQFANTIDILESQTFKRIQELIEDYTRRTLKISDVRIMTETRVGLGEDQEVGLEKKSLGYSQESITIKLKDSNGEFAGQMPYAYVKEVPLWIVCKNEKCLHDCDEYIDQWSKTKDIPKYRSIEINNIKTSIIIPLRSKSHNEVFGVINFETTKYIEATKVAKRELQYIAESMSILLQLSDLRETQIKNTEAGIKNLQAFLQRNSMQELTKPKIFLASSKNAEPDVIAVIRNVLEGYKNKLVIKYWKQVDSPGNINIQLLSQISSSRYGVCYFSGKCEDGSKYKYKDNPNVLFEAGMIHVRTDDASDMPASWIPVREKDSPTTPFDFASERMIVVPRDNNGDLKSEELKSKFKASVDRMIEHGEED